MSDRKGKPVTPIKKLTKKEKEELKKNVSSSGSSQCWIQSGTFNIVWGFFCIKMCQSSSDQQCGHVSFLRRKKKQQRSLKNLCRHLKAVRKAE